MKKFKKLMACVLSVALVMTSFVAFDATDIWAKGKVKSISVAKKVTVVAGKSKTVKVKIKTTKKASKKFTTKVSKKGIVKITKKSGKIVIKGLKAGTTKITVKSKANKKKKKTIKVTVKSADVTVSIRQFNGDKFQFTFSKAVKLNPDNVTIESKRYKSGKFVNKVLIKSLSTMDNKVYLADTDGSFRNGEIIRITIKGVNKANIVKELESSYSTFAEDTEEVVTALNTETIEREFYIDDIVARGNGKVASVSNLPAGLKATTNSGQIEVKGKIAKEGVYKTVFNLVDEFDAKTKLTVVFVVGTNSSLQTYSREQIVYTYSDSKRTYYSNGVCSIFVAGGSESYDYSIDKKTTPFADTLEYDGDNVFYWDYKGITKPGTYTGQVTIEDNNNANITKKATASVVAKKGVLITGKVTSITGKPVNNANVRVEAKTYVEGFSYNFSGTDKDGKYELVVAPSKCGIYAEVTGATSPEYEKNIAGSTTVNMQIPAYQVVIKSDNPKVSSSLFEGWYKADDDWVGYGDSFFLGKGYYDISSQCQSWEENLDITAKVKFNLVSDITVTAQTSGKPIATKTLSLGDNDVTLSTDSEKYLFVPPADGYYIIKSLNSESDPRAELIDYFGDYMDSSDDYDEYEFSMTDYLEAGKNYYICMEDCEADNVKTTVNIKQTEK